MNELEQALVGDSYAATPPHILEGLAGRWHRARSEYCRLNPHVPRDVPKRPPASEQY